MRSIHLSPFQLILGLLAVTITTPVIAATDDLPDFLARGSVLVDLRDRYEHVEQNGFASDADAHTIRMRLGYQTAEFRDLKALVELQDTEHLSQAFNDTVNGRTSFPVVSDPENLALNRLQLTYSGIPSTIVTVGRQIINFDDQRFIGASTFRQSEQTFDAIRGEYTGISGLTLNYFYADRVNRVFGGRSVAGHFNGDVQAFNAAYDAPIVGKIVGYIYLIDLPSSPTLSTATFGLQLNGRQPVTSALTLRYLAGFARQSGYASNPSTYSADYWRGEIGLDYGAWSTAAGIESLGGTGTTGFSTPLATLHAYQGYADVFLTTPARGVEDTYIRLGYQTVIQPFDDPWKLTAGLWHHNFNFARGSGSLGSEFDLESSLRFSDHWRIDVAHATYDGVAGSASRRKTWLAVSYLY